MNERVFAELMLAGPAIANPIALHYPIYRARSFKSRLGVDWAESYSYRPTYLCKDIGRAHRSGAPVFYSALSRSTAAKEVLREEREGLIHVSRWGAKRPYVLLRLAYPEAFLKSAFLGDVNSEFLISLRRRVQADLGDATDDFVYLSQELGRLFLAEDHEYSSRIAHEWMYTNRQAISKHVPIDGIWYPPVVSDHNGANIALLPSAVDNNMRLQAVFECTVTGVDSEGAFFRVTGVGIPDLGRNLLWYDVRLEPSGIRVNEIAIELPSGAYLAISPTDRVQLPQSETDALSFIQPLLTAAIPDFWRRIWSKGDVYDPGTRVSLTLLHTIEQPIRVQTKSGDLSATKLRIDVEAQLSFRPR